MHRRERFVGDFKYTSTETEVLTEEVCKSFESELQPAGSTPPFPGILTRHAVPVMVRHRGSGVDTLMQFQYSRFSPFHSTRLLEVWNSWVPKMAGSVEDLYRLVKEAGNADRVALDTDLLQYANLYRFREAVYIACYNTAGFPELEQIVREGLPPTSIFEDGGWIFNRAAELFIKVRQPEVFYVKGHMEDMNQYHQVVDVTLPASYRRHQAGLGAGISYIDSPLRQEVGDPLDRHTNNRFRPWESYELPLDVSTTRILAFIQAYLRDGYTGTTLV